MTEVCNNCGGQRLVSEPEIACPFCGILYEKVDAYLEKKTQLDCIQGLIRTNERHEAHNRRKGKIGCFVSIIIFMLLTYFGFPILKYMLDFILQQWVKDLAPAFAFGFIGYWGALLRWFRTNWKTRKMAFRQLFIIFVMTIFAHGGFLIDLFYDFNNAVYGANNQRVFVFFTGSVFAFMTHLISTEK